VLDGCLVEKLSTLVDQLVALAAVEGLQSVGRWYGSFEPVEDQQVLDLLQGFR
jgi:predicted phosphoribosyltransferase